jgi:hypothetical protein
MAELRNPPLRAAGLAAGRMMSYTGLSREREYQPAGDGERDAANPSPAEVVRRLHERMAASSPRLAALVAVYDDVCAGRREPLTATEMARELPRERPS